MSIILYFAPSPGAFSAPEPRATACRSAKEESRNRLKYLNVSESREFCGPENPDGDASSTYRPAGNFLSSVLEGSSSSLKMLSAESNEREGGRESEVIKYLNIINPLVHTRTHTQRNNTYIYIYVTLSIF